MWFEKSSSPPSTTKSSSLNDTRSSVCESPPSEVFFLPQKPYNVLGSLRDQIIYPSNVAEATKNQSLQGLDGHLLDILRSVYLGPLASRVGAGNESDGLGKVVDWSKQLSLGEQQRLAFARVLYNRPSVVFLDGMDMHIYVYDDSFMYNSCMNTRLTAFIMINNSCSSLTGITEATSALDLEAEKAMYDLLEEKLKATYVSVGHRPSLLKFHSTRLVVSPEQPLLVETIDPFSAADAVEATAMMEFNGAKSSST